MSVRLGDSKANRLTVNRKYVSRKINSLRWKPPNSINDPANVFVTGSWDDEENNLSVWYLNNGDGDPTLLQEVPQLHDINDIQYITRTLLAVGSGNGSVQLFEHNSSNFVDQLQVFENCHGLKSGPVSCTSLASNGEQVASVGEDGKIFIFNTDSKKAIKVIDSGSECSDYSVVFIKAAEILTANMQGHLKLWDLRAQNSLKATFLSPDQISVKTLSSHPTQQHLVATGGEDGSLGLWDMRVTSQPIVLVTAHSGPISEVQFHPTASDHLFSCGIDGKILHWDASASAKAILIRSSTKDNEEMKSKKELPNVWFSDDIRQGLLDAVSLIPTSRLPINSINVDADTLLAGSDNEAIFIIKHF